LRELEVGLGLPLCRFECRDLVGPARLLQIGELRLRLLGLIGGLIARRELRVGVEREKRVARLYLRAALHEHLCYPAAGWRAHIAIVAFGIACDFVGRLRLAGGDREREERDGEAPAAHDARSALSPRRNESMCCSMNASASSGALSNCSNVVRQIAT